MWCTNTGNSCCGKRADVAETTVDYVDYVWFVLLRKLKINPQTDTKLSGVHTHVTSRTQRTEDAETPTNTFYFTVYE